MFDPLEKSEIFMQLKRELSKASAHLAVTGCMESQKVQLAARLSANYKWTLYVSYDETGAAGVISDLKNFTQEAWLYPARDLLFYNSDIQGRYLENQRIDALSKLLTRERGILVTCPDALIDKVPARGTIDKARLSLYEGMITDPVKLGRILTGLGYEREPIVETFGQYAIRGGILDIYPMAAETPCRIELFGDEIDTIRSFDIVSQRSLERLESIEIYPTGGISGPDTNVSLLDYFDSTSLVILDDPIKIKSRVEALEKEFSESLENRLKSGINEEDGKKCADAIFSASFVMESVLKGRTLMASGMDDELRGFGASGSFHFHTSAVGHYRESFNLLISDLKSYQDKKYRITLLTPSITRTSRLAEDLRSYGIRAYCPDKESARELEPGDTEVICGSLRQGFCYTDLKYVLITEAEMFGRRLAPRHRKKYSGEALSSLGQLTVGDYVVHEDHGIGIYRGVEHIVRNDIGRDYIKIEYADKGRLYLPASKLDLLQKYSGAEGHIPKLNRLNGTEWKKTRQRAVTAARDIADDLVKLYSRRLGAKGYRFSHDTVWQKEFEELFPYEVTLDQQNAIEAVKSDMESDHIMDRLICGDVGYGKTEIALRAAFKAVQDSKQVAILVPTTILAQQHYNTFKERLAKFPVEIALMCRFRSAEENKKTARLLKSGGVDIVIGTHRLLSKDIGFKDLGLLIIDEEQRFGVAHKEKIKQLRTNVDVLALTATPIPRTLHMSLSGIRDMSLLDEPPFDRVPIQTYVLEYNDEFVREAIVRELSRKGQVFYVFNRVKGIEDKCAGLRRLIPDARIEFAHGRMPENELEDIMYEFVNGDIDVLVATTIVETGLDIPNANTLIVDGAERMGLAQLYQLRGRVGRSSRTAYSFFMYRKDRILSEEAEKRLKAIREFTGFGSGVRIAMRDLEIRGAGNVLGAEQHGQMQAVGYELYCKILSREVQKARGIKQTVPEFETTVDAEINAFIPDGYISDERQKLDIYKHVSELRTCDDYNDIIDELTDRYGDIPQEVMALIDTARLRAAAHDAYITELSLKEDSIKISMYPQARLRVEMIPEIIKEEEGRLKFIPGSKPGFDYHETDPQKKHLSLMMKKALMISLRFAGCIE